MTYGDRRQHNYSLSLTFSLPDFLAGFFALVAVSMPFFGFSGESFHILATYEQSGLSITALRGKEWNNEQLPSHLLLIHLDSPLGIWVDALS